MFTLAFFHSARTYLIWGRAFRAGQKMLWEEMEEEYREVSTLLGYSSDFHDQLKARLLQEQILIPVQVILEPTLQFRDKYRNVEYEPKMKAHLSREKIVKIQVMKKITKTGVSLKNK